MIPNQWYVVMDSNQVKDRPMGVTRLGEKLVFWRDHSDKVACLRDACVHRGVQMSLGKLTGDYLQCPFHGFEYDAAGTVKLIPANGKIKSVPKGFCAQAYPTYEAHGFIWIWWGEKPAVNLPLPRFFEDIDQRFSYASVHDPWKAHYSRVIENQLDVAHLPFIHYNTIGRGGRTLVDGPGLKWIADDMFYLYVYNHLDDGTLPLTPSQVLIPPPDSDFRLEFIFPNLWQNRIGEDTRIVAAFVPVDDNNTLLYLRFYQKFMRLPILRSLVNALAMPMNLYIAHQDRRVVNTHQGASRLKDGEMLIQSDRPIIEYRRKRQELMDQASS
jgi:phenylpropionate dioxygenase-like ring-hydroxylating dioxygenase large terminal subunit